MDAVILAGGYGTRLREVVPDVPKPLALINDRPFLDILLTQLGSFEQITKVILAIGYRAEQIVLAYEQQPNIAFSIEKSPLGTGGGLKKALEKTSSNEVLVCNGDSYLEYSLEGLIEQYSESMADMVIACHEEEDSSRYGQIDFEMNHRIRGFHEKSEEITRGWINGGVYLMKRDLLKDFPEDQPFSLEKDAFPKLLKKRVFGYPATGFFIDIGTKKSYFEAQEQLKGVHSHE